MKKIKTIIFDFDGVIANTLPFTFKKILEIARFLKVKDLTEKQIINEIRSKSLRELLRSGLNLSWFRLPFVIGMIKKMQMELGRELHTIEVFPGMKELLEGLKKRGFKMAILSSNMKDNIDKFMELKGIGVFDFVEGKTDSLMNKADLIEDFVEKYKLDRQETIYIGDEIRDVEASKKAGIRIVAVSWGLHKEAALRRHGADHIAKRPEDILKIIDKN